MGEGEEEVEGCQRVGREGREERQANLAWRNERFDNTARVPPARGREAGGRVGGRKERVPAEEAGDGADDENKGRGGEGWRVGRGEGGGKGRAEDSIDQLREEVETQLSHRHSPGRG